MEKMSEKTILITGSTSGIGLASAEYLFKSGYKVVLVGRNKEKLQDISRELGNSEYIFSDLEQTARIKMIFEEIRDRNLRLDGMLHAAGYVINAPVRLTTIEHMERQMKVHYYAFLELCKGFFNRKVSNDGASILAISSLASFTLMKGSILYSASKSAINSAVVVASKEFVNRSIRVNGLLPGYVDTRMTSGLDELIDVKKKQPLGIIPPESIAEVVEFFMSEKSRFITGALIPISAGMEF